MEKAAENLDDTLFEAYVENIDSVVRNYMDIRIDSLFSVADIQVF
ncbi:hypothetical protein [Chitinivibrio alkaliphilus]|uniref:Uncharacterized protein n=1 Tax=Chitinivibrio alkaliphilus ACht1 TaxID=1313304 RepID=U7D401_9BACT|nr:hypothetical protein [Chitinivibrio alkaliphilus]ERP31234.1 hypothetical protein CALK_1851 [Chitinivibrio alkaliphilus ACht1]